MTNGYKQILAAQNFLREVGWANPGDLSVDEMLNFKGAHIREAELKNYEGRITLHGGNAIVRINSNVSEGKRNFILAHELGHLLLHPNLLPVFNDTSYTLSDWYKKGVHEEEANGFATELLMPQDLFKKKVKGKKLNIALVEDVAAYFKTSLTATFLRYATQGEFPLMVVFIDKGVIEWKQASKDFPFPYLQLKTKVPAYTVAGDYFYKEVAFGDKPDKVDVIEWFAEDFNAQKASTWKIYEQCYHVSNTGIISCLWTF